MFHKVGVTPVHCDALSHEQRAQDFRIKVHLFGEV